METKITKIKCFWVSNPEDGDRELCAMVKIGESKASFLITPEGEIYRFKSVDLEVEDVYKHFSTTSLKKIVEETPDDQVTWSKIHVMTP